MRNVRHCDEQVPAGRDTQRQFMSGEEFLKSLDDAGLFGMWEDRNEIFDSTEFAQELRRSIEDREDR